jgi:hypothetical protein
MTDQQSLQSIPGNAPVDGHGAMTSPVRDEFELAEWLSQMAQIPVVTQNSQQGESFHSPLRLPITFNILLLWPFPYFIYLLHIDASGFISIEDLGKIPLIPPTIAQNGLIGTVAPLTIGLDLSQLT